MKSKRQKLTSSAKTTKGSTDNWQTPDSVLDVIRSYAPIGLDPCTAFDNPTKARVCYTKEGESEPWQIVVADRECIWVNPPFSKKLPFIHRALSVNTSPLFFLCRTVITPKWYRMLYDNCDMIAHWKKRVKYYDPATGRNASATFDTSIACFNIDIPRVTKLFSPHAYLERPIPLNYRKV